MRKTLEPCTCTKASLISFPQNAISTSLMAYRKITIPLCKVGVVKPVLGI